MPKCKWCDAETLEGDFCGPGCRVEYEKLNATPTTTNSRGTDAGGHAPKNGGATSEDDGNLAFGCGCLLVMALALYGLWKLAGCS
jgi:hypothetical protein